MKKAMAKAGMDVHDCPRHREGGPAYFPLVYGFSYLRMPGGEEFWARCEIAFEIWVALIICVLFLFF